MRRVGRPVDRDPAADFDAGLVFVASGLGGSSIPAAASIVVFLHSMRPICHCVSERAKGLNLESGRA